MSIDAEQRINGVLLIFQLTQFTISIAALAYLQALMTYYNRKMQRFQRLRQGLTQDFAASSDKHIEEDEGEESGSDESVETVPTSSPDYASLPIRTVDGSEEVFHGSKPASAAEIGKLMHFHLMSRVAKVSNISMIS
ncbi:unnamed protein product [Taenia asiatica]|uniref:Copper transporter n=1 Tax=Taenia asiatica TaxID=60517 RepID=A0A0R3WGU1_TAEAS|nr:unnamed protein product [Taenia asiatica]